VQRNPEIIFWPNAFIITNGKVKYQIVWDDIVKIITYKIDLWTIDEICIDIITDNKIYTISEEFHNWDTFTKVIENRLLSKNDWFPEVAHPAFARNETILYEKHI
jgi:hypothetical protein